MTYVKFTEHYSEQQHVIALAVWSQYISVTNGRRHIDIGYLAPFVSGCLIDVLYLGSYIWLYSGYLCCIIVRSAVLRVSLLLSFVAV